MFINNGAYIHAMHICCFGIVLFWLALLLYSGFRCLKLLVERWRVHIMKYESKEVGEELHIFTKTELFIVNLLEFFCVLCYNTSTEITQRKVCIFI